MIDSKSLEMLYFSFVNILFIPRYLSGGHDNELVINALPLHL